MYAETQDENVYEQTLIYKAISFQCEQKRQFFTNIGMNFGMNFSLIFLILISYLLSKFQNSNLIKVLEEVIVVVVKVCISYKELFSRIGT
jgi:hypothetical protein